MKSKNNLQLWITIFVLLMIIGTAFGLPTLKKTGMSWDANTELDLASYTVYWKTGLNKYIDTNSMKILPIEPFTTPPTTIKLAAIFPLQLPKGKHFFVVTASDTSGNESGFSNEVSYSFWFLNSPGNLKLE